MQSFYPMQTLHNSPMNNKSYAAFCTSINHKGCPLSITKVDIISGTSSEYSQTFLYDTNN